MDDDRDSAWDRFLWHPAVAGAAVAVNAYLVARRTSPVNVIALAVTAVWLVAALRAWADRRRRERGRGRGRPADSPAADQEAEAAAEQWHRRKSALMEQALGDEHDMVMHAIIPYAFGGGLDLYYYPNGVPGTAIATKELSEMPGEGSSNAVYRQYELVMFTRHPLDLDAAKDESTPFGRAHRTIHTILNHLAPYSAQATLNPNETCEFPAEMDRVGGKCLIFDAYTPPGPDAPADFGLLAAIEVFRSEMDYARHHGGARLIQRLKQAGHYPYSDLDREPVA